MAKDNSAGMNWAKARQFSNPRQREDYLYSPGKSIHPEGLHANCIGCHHINDKSCKYVKHPKMRKWPCYFRNHVSGL